MNRSTNLRIKILAIDVKTCKWCKETKPLSSFHKHCQMKDGRLNKCSSCVLENVYKWRQENPESRKQEYEKTREKTGRLTRKEYNKKLRKNAIGRKTSIKKYSHKRRLQQVFSFCKELDTFVFEEASELCELREKTTGLKWHIDHIVPLNHPKACGLHVAQNLQVVPALWNLQKGNRNMSIYLFDNKSC